MYNFIAIWCLIYGCFSHYDILIFVSGLFAIAGSGVQIGYEIRKFTKFIDSLFIQEDDEG